MKKATDAFDWFYREFSDDTGEPVFFLYSALAAYLSGEMEKARRRLLEASLSNIFLLPHLVGNILEAADIWHPSNRQHESYLAEIEDYLLEPSVEERGWIAEAMASEPFVMLCDGYVATFAALSDERDFAKRAAILGRWRDLKKLHLPGRC